MSDESLPRVFKSEIKKSLTGGILEEKTVAVQGENLEKCKKVFDKVWNEK